MKMDAWNIKEQRLAANSLAYALTGKKIRHSETGRPFIGKSADISVSHKDDFVAVATVPSPYRIGIDVEHLATSLNAELFLRSAMTKRELPFFKKFCEINNFPYSSGVAVFWSAKESFFKCLDYDLKPAKISVLDISERGEIQFAFSDEIKKTMEHRNLKFCSAKTLFKNEHIFSQTIMKLI